MKIKDTFQNRQAIFAAFFFGLIATYMGLNTVWTNDSVAYTYFSPVFDESSTLPINSFGDVLKSQADHYMTINGRFAVHTLVQSFCALLGHTAFAIANGCVWFLLIMLVLALPGKPPHIIFDEYFNSITYYDEEGEHSVMLQNDPEDQMMGRQSWYVASLLWIIFSPLPMDPAFQINYVWTAAMICGWFILFFNENIHRKSAGFLILASLYSLLCGSLHEGFSIPLAVSICLFLTTYIRVITRTQLLMSIAFGIGTLIVCLAPGNLLRFSILSASKHSDYDWMGLLKSFMQTGYVLWIPFLAFVFGGTSSFRGGRESKYFRRLNTLLDVAIGAGVLLCVVTGYFGRAAIPAAFFLVLSCAAMWERRWVRLWLPSALVIVALGMTGYKIYNQQSLNKISTLITDKYHESDSGIIYLDQDLVLDNLDEVTHYKWPYVKRERLTDPDKPYITIRPELMRDIVEPSLRDGVPVFERDTNMLMQIAPQSWLLYQSKGRPAKFTVDKVLLPGILNLKLSPRTITFDEESDFLIDTIGARQVVIYQNSRPYLRSNVRMEMPE